MINLYDEFFKVVKQLNQDSIPYALIGGIAMSFHSHPRYTKDIDFLFYKEDQDRVKNSLESIGLLETAKPWTFKNTNITLRRFLRFLDEDYLIVDIMIGNEKKHKEIVDNAIIENSEAGVVRIATRDDLIWLKKFRNSKQDQVDIEKLSE